MATPDRALAAAVRASNLVAATVGALVAALVFAVASAALLPRIDVAFGTLEAASEDVALAVARAVAGDVSRAVDLGIPLEEMRGVEPYLEEVVAANPAIAAVGIAGPSGTVLYRSGDIAPAGAGKVVRVALGEPGTGSAAGAVLVRPSGAEVTRARTHVVSATAAIALLAGLVAGVLVRIFRLERVDLPLARFVAGGRAVARGLFADFSPPPPGSPLRPLGTAAARLTSPVRRAHRRLLAVVDEVRALDTARTLAGRIEEALAPLSAYGFDRALRARPREVGLVWWPAAALASVEAARPLAASFAADRIGADPLAAVAVAAASGADSVGGILGVGAAVALRGRLSKPVTVVAMLTAAAALAAVSIQRDAEPFVFLVGISSFAVWLAAFSVLLCEGRVARRPFQAALVLLAAWAIGPAVGALLAEAEGRRMAFATIGGIAAIVAVASAFGAARRAPRRLPRHALSPAEAASLAATGLAVFAWMDIHLASRALLENYAALALHFALAGAAALLPFAAGARLPASAGAAVAALAVAGPTLSNVPDPLATTALGIGTGLVLLALGARALTPAAVSWLLAGGVLAAALPAIGYLVQPDDLPLSAAAAAGLAAVAVLARTRTGRL